MMATTETEFDSTTAQTQELTLEEKMPESVKRFGDAFGRLFDCPECGAPTNGTCPDCGHTHAQHRDHNDGRGA